MKRRIFTTFLLCMALAGCASFVLDIHPVTLYNGAQEVQGGVVRALTDTAPLRGTSQYLLRTVVAVGATQAPPVLTAVSRTVNQVSSGLNYTQFRWPLVVAVPRAGCMYGSKECREPVPLTGMELTTGPNNQKLSKAVLAAGPGRVARIQEMGEGCASTGGDCGMGNTVILEHTLRDGSRLYSLYAHLSSISPDLEEGVCVLGGDELGVMGASGFGEEKHWSKAFLHFEFKSMPVLGDPKSAKAAPKKRPDGKYFGYLTGAEDGNPDDWGYFDPVTLLDQVQVVNCR